MTHAFKLMTSGDIDILDVPEDMDYRWYAEQIGCDMIEIVNAGNIGEGCVMIVDEEGLLKEDPEINPIASIIYGFRKHGNPIVGNVLIMQTKSTIEGVDTVGLETKQLTDVYQKIVDIVINE